MADTKGAAAVAEAPAPAPAQTTGTMNFDVVEGSDKSPMIEADLQPEIETSGPHDETVATNAVVEEQIEAPPEQPEKPATEEVKPETVALTKAEAEALRAAKEQRDNFAALLDDPELRTAYLKKIKADGLKRDPNFQLAPELEAMIAPPAKPGPTKAQVLARMRELEAQGKYAEAREIEREYITKPELRAELQKAQDERDQKAASEAARARQQQIYREELTACHKAFPTIMDDKGRFLDKAVLTKIQSPEFIGTPEAPGALANVPVKDAVRFALFTMGRLGQKPQTRTAPASANARTTATRGAPPAATKNGMMTFEIVEK